MTLAGAGREAKPLLDGISGALNGSPTPRRLVSRREIQAAAWISRRPKLPASKPRHSFGCDLKLFERRRETAAQETLATRPKRAPRDAGDFLLLQQFHRKLFRCKAGWLDTREGVKRTARQMAGKPHGIEGIY